MKSNELLSVSELSNGYHIDLKSYSDKNDKYISMNKLNKYCFVDKYYLGFDLYRETLETYSDYNSIDIELTFDNIQLKYYDKIKYLIYISLYRKFIDFPGRASNTFTYEYRLSNINFEILDTEFHSFSPDVYIPLRITIEDHEEEYIEDEDFE